MGEDGGRLRQGGGSFRTAQTEEVKEEQVDGWRIRNVFESKRVDHRVPRGRRGWALWSQDKYQPIGCPGRDKRRGSVRSPILAAPLATNAIAAALHPLHASKSPLSLTPISRAMFVYSRASYSMQSTRLLSCAAHLNSGVIGYALRFPSFPRSFISRSFYEDVLFLDLARSLGCTGRPLGRLPGRSTPGRSQRRSTVHDKTHRVCSC
jgi:hypothetical protein